MIYNVLVKTVTVTETGHVSTVQDIVQFSSYEDANDAVKAVNETDPFFVEVFQDRSGIAKSKTTAIKMYK